MTDAFRVVSREVLLRSRVFDVERREVEGAGESFTREVVTHRGAVAVLARDDAGRVGVLFQYRATFDAVGLEIPAGTLDVDGEDPRDAAARELEEELGVRAATWRRLGRFMVSPGWCDQVMTIYEATDLTMVERRPAGPEESAMRVAWLTPSELLATLRDAPLIDYTTAVALHRVYGTFLDD
ncbi:MAG: NUDIX domain-containing protein [Acidimicrobiales bacterium]